jgi:aspartate carbamoyltransferase catalytic subunit
VNLFHNQSIISIRDLGRDRLEAIFEATDRVRAMPPERRRELCRGRILGYVFYEPSTRTRLSFEAAMSSLGGSSLGHADVASSSAQKGESLADTVRTISAYSDLVVLRHPLDGSSRFAAEVSSKPVINAGSGTEEHPTQALLDIYTIQKEKGRVDGLNIGIVGDLKHGRTVYSLLYGLSGYDVNVYLVSPPSLRIRPEFAYGTKRRMKMTASDDLGECVEDLDVLYVTRIQRERFADSEEYEKVRGSYVVGLDMLRRMRPDSIIMHPLPRVDEIAPEVDSTPHARYFEQAEYGKHVRAALLHLLLNGDA